MVATIRGRRLVAPDRPVFTPARISEIGGSDGVDLGEPSVRDRWHRDRRRLRLRTQVPRWDSSPHHQREHFDVRQSGWGNIAEESHSNDGGWSSCHWRDVDRTRLDMDGSDPPPRNVIASSLLEHIDEVPDESQFNGDAVSGVVAGQEHDEAPIE